MLSELDRLGRSALIAGLIGLAVWVAGSLALGFDRGWLAYLTAFVFWLGLALGCLALALLHQLTGGGWGTVIRRPLESAAATLPVLALLLLPLLAGLRRIYEWARPEAVAADAVLQAKAAYLNVPFFAGRAVLYFAVWILLALSLQRRPRWAAGGLVLYALTVTFASVDWVMSLDPRWFSTIFGILTIGGQALSALAFVTAVLVLLARHEPLAGVVRPSHYHDLGKLMLAFVMLWAYFNLSQFLIVWAGNLPEEIPWYVRRLHGPARWAGLALVVLHFALPFLLLLSADVKKRPRTLAAVALLVLVMRGVDMIWLVAPEYRGQGAARSFGVLLDVAALAAIGGLWIWRFAGHLRERVILPLSEEEAGA